MSVPTQTIPDGYANTGLSERAHHTINRIPPIWNYVYMSFHVNLCDKSDMGKQEFLHRFIAYRKP